MTIFSTGGEEEEEEHSGRCVKQRGNVRCESEKVGNLNGVTNMMNLPICIETRTRNEVQKGGFGRRYILKPSTIMIPM